MERVENKKRERDEQGEGEEYQTKNDSSSETNNANKKQELIYFDNDHDLFTIKTDYSSFRPLGVFDFPWLKDNRVSESDDWKFDYDDEFSYNNLLVDDAVFSAPPDDGLDLPEEVLCERSTTTTTHDDELGDTTTAGEKLEDKSWLTNGDDLDGLDCIWSCVLNQPLISAAGTGCGGGSRQKEYRVVG